MTTLSYERFMSIREPLILLAEDNEFTAETMQDYLLFHGYRVNLARNGLEVIEFALSTQPDLILWIFRCLA
jgi:CheY-like chemotaxis protein